MAAGTAHSSVQATVRQGTRLRASRGEWAAATTANGSSRSGTIEKVIGGRQRRHEQIAASPDAATPSDAKTDRCLRKMATRPVTQRQQQHEIADPRGQG